MLVPIRCGQLDMEFTLSCKCCFLLQGIGILKINEAALDSDTQQFFSGYMTRRGIEIGTVGVLVYVKSVKGVDINNVMQGWSCETDQRRPAFFSMLMDLLIKNKFLCSCTVCSIIKCFKFGQFKFWIQVYYCLFSVVVLCVTSLTHTL